MSFRLPTAYTVAVQATAWKFYRLIENVTALSRQPERDLQAQRAWVGESVRAERFAEVLLAKSVR